MKNFYKENKYMWLLKLHFAFSILCLITFFWSYDVFERCLKRNGYVDEIKGKKIFDIILGVFDHLFLYPTNVCSYFKHIEGVIIIFQMIRMSKDEFMDW